MIPDEVVEQVLHAADIVAIIGEHVKLKKTGSVYRGPCPFHQGTNSNFSVVPGKGYTCFVCHEKGSVFTFVQKRMGLSFAEAVKYVGEKAGVEVRDEKRTREGPDPREPLWEINNTAAGWFRDMLWDNVLGAPAREYLKSRNVSRETADKFGLGFAPRELGLMRSYLNGLGFTDDRLLAIGLLAKREEHDEPRPRFRDRLIFPILDMAGHTVGFGGRLLGPGEPKYLNSPETEIFSKGKLLYNLSNARGTIRREERVILVEGYFDVVRLVDAGIEAVVAPMGTALATEQADLLGRLAPQAFLLYDSDLPGQKASFRAADILLARGMSVRMITLPDGDDPDSYVAAHGRAAMEKLIDGALDVFDRKVQIVERKGLFSNLQKKRSAIDHLMPTIRAATDPITRDLYLGRLSVAADVDKEVLVRELAVSGAAMARRARATATMATPREVARAEGAAGVSRPPGPYRGVTPESSAERDILRVMLLDPVSADGIQERIARIEADLGGHGEFDDLGAPHRGALRDPVYHAIFEALVACGAGAGMEELAEQLDPVAIEVVETLKGESGSVMDQLRTVDGAIAVLTARTLEERIAEIDGTIGLVAADAKDALLLEKQALARELARLGGRGAWGAVRRGST